MRPAIAIIAAGLALAGGTALWSAPRELPGQADRTRIAAGTYLTDPSHTLVEWRVWGRNRTVCR
jgi:hypothetical protein